MRGLSRQHLVAVAVTTAAAAVAGLELRRVFDLGTLLVPVVVLAVAGAAGPLLARWRGLPAVVGPLVSVSVGLVAVGATVADAGGVARVVPGPALVRTVVDAVVNGWAQILSTGIPAPPRPSMVLVAPLLAWAASWLGAEVVLRTRAPAFGVLPPVAALVAASVLVVPAGGSRVPAAVLLGIAAAALLVVGATPDARRGLPTVRPVRAAAMGVVVLLAGAALAPHLPWIGDAPTKDPRPDEPRPEQQVTPVNPLSLLAGWAAEPDAVVARVRADRAVPLRLGVLDRFDGTSWTASTVLQVAGSTLPPDQVGGGPVGPRVRQEVTLEDLPGTFLPAAEQPVAYDGPAAWWDASHGILYQQRPAAGDDPVRYEVTSAVPPAAEAGERAVDRSDPATLETPGAPARLGSLALEATPSGTTPYAKALLLEGFLRERAVFDPDAPSGSSWATLQFFLLNEPDEGGRRGTSEQFATGFAVLARLQGLPTRVVVGARPPDDGGAGTWTVRAGDLEAWPEIRFEGVGWVAFDPTPARSDAPPPTTTTTTSPRSTTQPALPPDDASVTPPVTSPGAGEGRGGAPEPSPSVGERLADLARPTALAGLALLLVAPLLVVAAKAGRRRRRRSAAGEAAQVLGAWDEVADDLRGRGLAVTTATSRRAVARAAAEPVGADTAALVDDLAQLANAVTFSATPPPEGLGRAAWGLVDRVRAASAAGLPWWRRARRAVDPRTLRQPPPPRPGTPADAPPLLARRPAPAVPPDPAL